MGFWKSVGSAIGGGAKAVYGVADRTSGGYLPGAHRPLHEAVIDYGGDAGGAAGDVASTGWDVLSGNRDARRARANATTAYERQRELMEDTAGIQSRGLQAAGINPILAGQLGGNTPSVQAAHSTNSSGALSGAINNGVSLLSSLTSLRKAIGEVAQMGANTRKTQADTAYVQASTPGLLQNLALQGPQIQANTAESVARTERTRREAIVKSFEADHSRLKLPQSKAEAEFYRKKGSSAIYAREVNSPWKAGMLISDLAGRDIEASAPSLSTAADVLSRAASKKVIDGVKRNFQWPKIGRKRR